MNTLNGFLSAITSSVKNATGINLDTVQPAPLVTHIAEDLLKHDLIPATRTDIEESYAVLTGNFPTEGDLAEVELFLHSFGWLA
ncbi:hypothetical protein [Corynebacterium sp. HMSC078H07]|uniref:hypothetical protein n=1 Tax=Corynebacterium sp. HMSC078H07 TaxID=1739379 RepID=UPI0008A35394|nr:hypothetical protein [Corynebacterium sp. HMSC078H07]OFR63690.1 hypothetical protein HMPREF2875_12995 [Corynebacterium sp. HMSC078H07]